MVIYKLEILLIQIMFWPNLKWIQMFCRCQKANKLNEIFKMFVYGRSCPVYVLVHSILGLYSLLYVSDEKKNSLNFKKLNLNSFTSLWLFLFPQHQFPKTLVNWNMPKEPLLVLCNGLPFSMDLCLEWHCGIRSVLQLPDIF